MSDENQFVFFGVKPCLFLEVDVFFCFSRDGCNQLRDHFTTLQLELSKSYLPSKHRKAGQLAFSIRRIRFKKAYFPNIPNTRCFFFGKLFILAYIESPPKKYTPKKNDPSRHHFIFDPKKPKPIISFLRYFLQRNLTRFIRKRGLICNTKEYPRKLSRDFFLFKRIVSKKTEDFLQENLTRFLFSGRCHKVAPNTSYLLLWNNSTYRLSEVKKPPVFPFIL